MSATRPAAAPRRARDRRLCAGQEQRARRRQGVQAVVQRDAARAEPEGDRGLQRGRRASARTIRTARRPTLREAIGRAFGLDPARIVCGAGSDDLLNLLARAYLADGDEAIHTTHGFLVYPIATLGAGATPVVAPEKNYTADVDAILAAVTPNAPRSCSSPTRTIRPAPTCRSTRSSACIAGLPPHVLLVLDAAYAEYVRRNDYEAGIELVATSRERRDDAHVLEDLRPRGAAARLDLRPGARGRRAQPHPRAVQRQRAGDRGRHRGDRGRRASSSARARTTTKWLPG